MALPSTPDRKPKKEMLGGRIAQINIGKGDEQEVVIIHHGLLCCYSGYFRDIFNTRFIEETDEVDLPDENVDTFKHFQLWLYTYTFDQDYKQNLDRDCKQNLDRLVELWVFADEYRIPLLQNMVLNEIRDQVAFKPALLDIAHINFVYQHTVPNSGLRHFVIDIVCRRMSSKDALDPNNSTRITEEASRDILQYV